MPRLDIGLRVEDYSQHATSLKWIHINMLRWESRLPKIETSIGYNLTFRFILNFYLSNDLHIPSTFFDFNMPDFIQNWIPAGKDTAVLNPLDLLYKDIGRFIWDVRYKLSEKSLPYHKSEGLPLKEYINIYKDILKKKGVNEIFLDILIEKMLITEGKIINASYVGYSSVGVSKVMKPAVRRGVKCGVCKIRWCDDYSSEKEIYTRYPYETLVNYSRVNYSRVIPPEDEFKKTHLRPLSKDLAERVKEFKMRSCNTPITKGLDVEVRPEIREITKNIEPPKYTLYQRIFFLKYREKMLKEGSKHQARLQNIIVHVKSILNRYGISGSIRPLYISFAEEYSYMHYKSHRKYKRWKRLLSKYDIVEKYSKAGCDIKVLREIMKIADTFKSIADLE